MHLNCMAKNTEAELWRSMEYFCSSSYTKIVCIMNYGFCFVFDVQYIEALEMKISYLLASGEILWYQESGHVAWWKYMIM